MSLRQFFISNRWWGKFLGALLGYILGGPAGALIGILIGNYFDRSLSHHFSHPMWQYYVEKRRAAQNIFFDATFSIMGHIAKKDGRVSEQEIQVAKDLMVEMRLNKEQKSKAQQLFNEGKKSSFVLVEKLNDLSTICQSNTELLKLFVDIQYRVALAGGLTFEKIQALDFILHQLGFAPLRSQYRYNEGFSETAHNSTSSGRSYTYNRSRGYQNAYQPPPNSLDRAYAILETNKEASRAEVKRAYRRLISRNHPDKLIAQGLPEEMIRIANEKTQTITKAYEQICASQGWS